MVFLLFGGCGDHGVDELDSRRYGGLAAEVQTPKSYKVIKLKRVQNWIGGIGIVAVYDERERVAYTYGKVGLKDRSHGNS